MVFGDGPGNLSAVKNVPVGNAPVRGSIVKTAEELAGAEIVGSDTGGANRDGKIALLATRMYGGQLYLLLNHCPSAG